MALERPIVKKDNWRYSVSCEHDREQPCQSQPRLCRMATSAGGAQEVGLPMVAGVMNAAQYGDRRRGGYYTGWKRTESRFRSPAPQALVEHPADQQIQFATGSVAANTNPAHSFEIYAITESDGKDVTDSFVAVAGSKLCDAQTAFGEQVKLIALGFATASAISISPARQPTTMPT